MLIQGTVTPGFEPVRQLYEHNMQTLAERNTQLCVYRGEECVVDLWGSAVDDATFSADSLVNVFSSGKSLEAIALAMLVDQGLLSYDKKITEYWPEFGANGKGATTVADLMRHEGGLAAFNTTLDPEHLQAATLPGNVVGAIIEQHPQKFRSGVGNEREYHAITRGWIANEVFRRVEPQGRTMGQYLRDEVSGPLEADVYIGLQDAELSRVSPVAMLGMGYQIGQGLIPKVLGRKMERNLAQTVHRFWQLRGVVKNRTTAGNPPPITGMRNIDVFNSPAVAKAEIPSAGAKCSARGLAKLAAAMANGGSFNGRRLMGDDAWAQLHSAPVERNMMALNTTFTQGGLAQFSKVNSAGNAGPGPLDAALNQGREGFFGWMGLGGSIFQWHPEKKIGFAYAPTSLNVLDIVNERGKAYQAQVLRCLES